MRIHAQEKRPAAPPSSGPQCRGLFQGTRDSGVFKTVATCLQSQKLPVIQRSLHSQGIAMINFTRPIKIEARRAGGRLRASVRSLGGATTRKVASAA